MTGHAPPLETEADWIKAGEIVFDYPLYAQEDVTVTEVREPAWYQRSQLFQPDVL